MSACLSETVLSCPFSCLVCHGSVSLCSSGCSYCRWFRVYQFQKPVIPGHTEWWVATTTTENSYKLRKVDYDLNYWIWLQNSLSHCYRIPSNIITAFIGFLANAVAVSSSPALFSFLSNRMWVGLAATCWWHLVSCWLCLVYTLRDHRFQQMLYYVYC